MPPAGCWRASSSPSTNTIRRILRRRLCGGCARPHHAASGSHRSPPYGYRKVHVQDGAKKRPVLDLALPLDAVVGRIFSMALGGTSILDITKTLNADGVPSPDGKRWMKTSIHRMLANEAYTGTLVWGTTAKDNTPPVRVENAFPATVSQREFKRVAKMLRSKAPKVTHPRRTASPYLLSGLLTCQTCGKALSAAEAKGGRYTYYVCHSLLKRGSGECTTPRLNAKRFERLIVDQIRQHILTESNMRELVKMVNEEMNSVIREQQERVEAADAELADIRRRMDRLWELVEKTDLTTEEILPRIRHHLENQERLEQAADEARSILALRRANVQDVERIAAYAREMSGFLMESEVTETKAFIRSFVKEVTVRPGKAVIHYAIPTPLDNDIEGADIAEVALSRRVMKSVTAGWAKRYCGVAFEWVVSLA